MDKRVIFAVAGSGKTTHIVKQLSLNKRSLIVTYTKGNYDNLSKKISEKFEGKWPDNIVLMTYFSFLFRFCYKPFWADRVKAKGIIFENNPNQFAKQTQLSYFISPGGYFYSNRLSLFFEKTNTLTEIKSRISTYFDELIIDEIQDIAGRDFLFLEKLMEMNLNMLFVGDFYQHTFDTSRDGNVNKTLFNDKATYESRFINKGFTCDNSTLTNSWRCSISVCKYIKNNLGIEISSNRLNADDTEIVFITDPERALEIVHNDSIIKLHFNNGAKYGRGHRNWGETKGEDHYQDVCVILNKTTANLEAKGNLKEMAPSSKNKLYVAITRARGNVYFLKE